jgi:hypothetical protein
MLLEAGDLAVEAGALREALAALEALGQKPGRWLALRFKVFDLQERVTGRLVQRGVHASPQHAIRLRADEAVAREPLAAFH